MSVENIYTSIACNRTTESADWGNNGLIVFGAFNSVAIYNPQVGRRMDFKINLIKISKYSPQFSSIRILPKLPIFM